MAYSGLPLLSTRTNRVDDATPPDVAARKVGCMWSDDDEWMFRTFNMLEDDGVCVCVCVCLCVCVCVCDDVMVCV